LWNAVVLVLSDRRDHIILLVNLICAVLVLAASAWALVRGPRAWGAWGVAVLTLYLTIPASEPLDGVLRYMLPILPVWLLPARLLRRPSLEAAALGLESAFLALLTALFVNSYWVA
jgi:hypothetical protein